MLPVNLVPLSDINLLGVPNRHTICFQTKFFTRAAVMVVTASTSIHLVKYSMATIKNFTCLAEGETTLVCRSPRYGKAMGSLLNIILLEGLGASLSVSNIGRISGRSSDSLVAAWANNIRHG